MDMHADTGREFWRDALSAGGLTTIPRWTTTPAPGSAGHEARIPDELAQDLRRLAKELGIPVTSLVLAAHAHVLAVLSGESDAVTGCVPAPGARPLPYRVSTDVPSWRNLVEDAHATVSRLVLHRDFPVEDLRRQLAITGPVTEAEFDPFGAGGDMGAGTVLRLVVEDGDGDGDGAVVLRLRYRTDVLDGEAAGRIAGYHLAALEQIVAGPDTAPASVVSDQEVAFQVEGLAGRRRELPGLRVHELFEERVRA
ncbi:non-ribosomal peptide synthetase, partial [Streptomyces wuyuanensis]